MGTNLNLITYSKWSTRIYTDACEHGLGGWNTETGVCWRLRLPPWMLGRYHINFLEFLASWIGIWIELLNSTEKYQRILCLTDSSSALGWLYKANFCPDSQKHNDTVARKLAEEMLEHEAALYSQHIKGSSNTIADSLSRDHSSTGFKDVGAGPGQDYLISNILQGWRDQEIGIASGTNAQQAGSFARFGRFLDSCGISDPFLDGFDTRGKLIIMSAFASSLRRNENGKTKLDRLLGTTVRSTIAHVCASFRTNLRRSPVLEEGGQTSLALNRQIKGYINEDPAVKHQKCLPIGVFRKIWSNRASSLTTAIGQLAVGALFFGMRSCEYSCVTGDRKTKLLQVKDIRFFRGRREIQKSSINFYRRADSVTICFAHQKNGEKEGEITMHKSNKGLCPVMAWGQIVSRILSYPKVH